MGVIMHNNIPYGGGSSIEPNPQESATEQLETLGIDGDVYEVTDANAIHTSDVGVANGVASLDATGRVPSTQLPSYVDDVLEYASQSAFPATGESGKIYIALDTNLTYRWSGSAYVEISQSLALGTTHQTAAYGDDAVSTAEPTYSEAITRTNLAGSGEKLSVIFGKIKKWFSDLKDLAFIGKDGASSTKYLRGDGTWQSALELQGRVYESGDDEGLVIKPASNHWAGISLVNNTGRHTYFAMKDGQSDVPLWRFNDGSNAHDIIHPAKSGTIAVTSDITDEKVTGQTQNPSSITAYNVPFIGTTNQKPYYNDGLKYSTKEGDVNNVGVGQLWLGNGTSSGTAGNKKGSIILYGEKNGYANLKASPNSTTDRDIFFPDASGTVALTNDIPAAVAVKGDKETAYRTGNVNLTSANIGATKYHGDLRDTLGSGTPAAATKTYYDNNVSANSVEIAYDSSGEEFTILFSKGSENYGNIIKYGYGNDYLWKLGKQNGTWLSDDWVKFKAGYADTAGSAPASDVSAWAKASTKPSYNFDEIGAGNVFVGDGGNYIKYRNATSWKAGIYYNTFGDEAAVFANENTRASWIFANANVENRSQWTALSPAMHIKNGKVAIGKLIANSAYLTYPLEVNGDVQATNFRGNLVGTADKATKDGDGNVISSTYQKIDNKPSTGYGNSSTATAITTGYRDITSISINQLGIYLITAWGEFNGGTGSRAVLITNSNNSAYAQCWNNDSLAAGNPVQFTCNYLLSLTSSSSIPATVKVRVYTSNNNTSSINGGITAVRVM